MVTVECCKDDVFLWTNPDVSSALVTAIRNQWDFSIGVYISAENVANKGL